MLTLTTVLTIAAAATAVAAEPAANSTSRMLARGCFLAHNVDFRGNDLTSVKASSSDQCCIKCWDNSRCKSWTWTNFEGGTCWLKSRFPDAVVINVGADSCTMNSGQTSGTPFKNCDMPGNDLYSESVSDYEACGNKCASNSACKAATWSNGVCYYKYDVRPCEFKAEAWTNVVANRFVAA